MNPPLSKYHDYNCQVWEQLFHVNIKVCLLRKRPVHIKDWNFAGVQAKSRHFRSLDRKTDSWFDRYFQAADTNGTGADVTAGDEQDCCWNLANPRAWFASRSRCFSYPRTHSRDVQAIWASKCMFLQTKLSRGEKLNWHLHVFHIALSNQWWNLSSTLSDQIHDVE